MPAVGAVSSPVSRPAKLLTTSAPVGLPSVSVCRRFAGPPRPQSFLPVVSNSTVSWVTGGPLKIRLGHQAAASPVRPVS